MAKPEKHLTDEQRVAIWLGWRQTYRPWGRKLTTADVQEQCAIYWRRRDAVRLPSTWLRAFWRAAAAGMLGTVTRGKRERGLYVYTYTATKRELMRAAGVEYKAIPHGKRKGVK